MRSVKRIQHRLQVQLPHLLEEQPDPFVVLSLVQQDKFHIAWRDERGHRPLVEFVDRFQIHGIFSPHHFLDAIKAGVGDHLDYMAVLSPSHLHTSSLDMMRLRST